MSCTCWCSYSRSWRLCRHKRRRRIIPAGMADQLQPERARSRLATAGMLVGLTTIAGIVGVVLSTQQRPLNVALLPQVFSGGPTPAAPGPVSAFGFSVADDPAIHRVLLFGGVDSYDQTWLWDGSRWSRASPRISPLGRFQAAAAYDPETKVVMLFGGRLAAGRIVNDTWAWSGASWRELDTGGGSGPPGEGALMAWDNATRAMVLLTPAPHATGGQTWMWSGSHWLRQANGEPPPTPIAGEMAFDPSSNSLLFVSALSPPLGAGTTTWRFDGAVGTRCRRFRPRQPRAWPWIRSVAPSCSAAIRHPTRSRNCGVGAVPGGRSCPGRASHSSKGSKSPTSIAVSSS
jgi:hypothetical protein